MSARFALAAIAASCAAACHDFAQVEADGRCGNRVLERAAGEDCDTFAALPGTTTCGAPGSPEACRYVCDPDAAAPGCPEGWSCGRDAICRAPSGRFTGPSVIASSGTSFDLGDADGDGRLDLLTASRAGVTVGFGAEGRRFDSLTTLETAPQSAPPRLADLDGDGLAEVTIALETGVLIARGLRSRAVTPLAFAFHVGPAGARDYRVVPVRASAPFARQVTLALDVSGGEGSATVLESLLPTGDAAFTEALAEAAARGSSGRLFGRVPVADLEGGGSADEIAIGVEGDDEVYVFTVECKSSCALTRRTSVVFPALLDPAGAWFADADGDGRLDLLAAAGGQLHLALASADGFGEPFADRALPAAPLAIADLDGDRIADFAGPAGSLITTSTSPRAYAPGPAPARGAWTLAAAGDFNADARPDLATSDTSGDVTVYLGAGGGLYSAQDIPTGGAVREMRAGDFDGDLLEDLALIEGASAITVLFGDPRGVLSRNRAVMGQAEGLTAIASEAGGDGASDLIALVETGTAARRVIRLDGSSSRRMVAQLGFEGDLAGAIAGSFRGKVELLLAGSEAGAPIAALIDGSAQLDAPHRDLLAISRTSSCGVFASSNLVMAAGDADGDGRDEAVAIDGTTGLAAAPVVIRIDGGTLSCARLEPPAALTTAGHLALADLDGDGRRDLLASYARGFAIWWSAGGTPFEHVAPAGPTFAAPVRGDRDGARELVILEGGLLATFEVARTGVTRAGDALPFSAAGLDLRDMRAADVDGDGLDDVLIGATTQVFLFPHLSCTAIEAASGTCERGDPE